MTRWPARPRPHPWRRPATRGSTRRASPSILAQAAGGHRAKARRDVAARLLGLEGEAPAFGTLADLAGPLGLGGQPQVSQTLAKIRDAWADDRTAAALLDQVEDRVVDLLDQLDGVAWADTVVEAASPQDANPRHRRLVAGLIRAALDRGDDKARGADEEPRVHRRRLRGARRPGAARAHPGARRGRAPVGRARREAGRRRRCAR